MCLQTEQLPLHRRLFENGMARRNNSEVTFTRCPRLHVWGSYRLSFKSVLCDFNNPWHLACVETLGMNFLCSFDMLSLQQAETSRIRDYLLINKVKPISDLWITSSCCIEGVNAEMFLLPLSLSSVYIYILLPMFGPCGPAKVH